MTALPYVVPFGVFVAFLALRAVLALPLLAEQVLWAGVTGAAILVVSKPVLDFRVSRPRATLAIGLAGFTIWIAPDVLIDGYRDYWLFNNPVTGAISAGMPEEGRRDAAVLALRTFRAAIVVPIAEELFWRGWLMRWLVNPDFVRVPLGTYTGAAFWIVAVLFASEHGPFWDVGLAAGILYNWWMLRTRSLGDLILAHGVTNLCLSAYVIAAGKWEYW